MLEEEPGATFRGKIKKVQTGRLTYSQVANIIEKQHPNISLGWLVLEVWLKYLMKTDKQQS